VGEAVGSKAGGYIGGFIGGAIGVFMPEFEIPLIIAGDLVG